MPHLNSEQAIQSWKAAWRELSGQPPDSGQGQARQSADSSQADPEKVALDELCRLIANHFRQEWGGDAEPSLRIRDHARRQRMILSWSHATVTPPPRINDAVLALRPLREPYLKALASSLEGSVAAVYDEDRLQAYELVLKSMAPAPEQAIPADATPAPASPKTEEPAATNPELSASERKAEKKRQRQEELKRFFIDSIPADIEALETAHAEADWESVRGKAHQLKGCAASFGFPEVTEDAALLDQAIKEGDQASYEPGYAALLAQLRRIVPD